MALQWDNHNWIDHNIPISMIKCAVFGEGYYYNSNSALCWAATVMFWATLALAVLVAAGYILWLFQKRQSAVEKVFLSVALAVSVFSYTKFCLAYPYVCTMNIRYIIVALYLAFLIFGGAVGTLIEGIGRKSALAAKGMKAGAVALAGGYVAGAVALIVQAGQVLP